MLNTVTYQVLHLPRIVKRSIVLFVDALACALSVYLAFYLRLGEWINPFDAGYWRIFFVIEVSLALCLPLFIGFGLYREIFRHSGWFALMALLRAMALYTLIFIAVFTFYGFEGVPRTIGFIQPLLLLMVVGGTRAIAGYWLSRPYRKHLKLAALPQVLIYGAGEAGRQLASALSHSYEMRVAGFLDDDPLLQGSVLEGLRIYSPIHLIDLTASLNVQGVLLAIPSASRARRNQIIKVVQEAKLSIQTLPSMSDLAQGKVVANDLKSLDVDDLLGRDSVLPNANLLTKNSYQKVVLVTGAGGSIGSELCRQIAALEPAVMILVDQSEYALYQIHQELESKLAHHANAQNSLVPILASVANEEQMRRVISQWQPHIIYHAAAYKHVPLVESNIVEGVRNNVMGTLTLAKMAMELNVPNFVLISTDKAVRPTNVMGASKRLAEMVLQALSQTTSQTQFAMVRFGNVLNSSGSVVPRFRQQIKEGGPVTVTDLRMTRYFMTIPEAAQLVIQAGALATGGDVFLLDMGEPVKIVDLARSMIELSGLEVKDSRNPEGDIEIQEIGLRPGEKLYEELLIDGNPAPTNHPRIFKSHEEFLSWVILDSKISQIEAAIARGDERSVLETLKELVSGYTPKSFIT